MSITANPIDYSETTATVSHDGKAFAFSHVDRRDHIFASLKETGTFYEREFLVAMANFLQPQALVIDIGANIGNHTIFLSGVCGCRVTAFEPNPEAATLLSRNVAANGLADLVRIERVAVGAARHKGTLVAPEAHNLGTVRIVSDPCGDIDIVPLDEMAVEDKVSLIKIDVEGMDLAVLRGATALIERDRPAIAIEIDNLDAYLAAARLLDPLGYTCGGSFNYTPSHIFACTKQSAQELAHRLALQYIGSMARHRRLNEWLVGLQNQFTEADERAMAALVALDARQGIFKTTIDGLAAGLAEITAGMARLEQRVAELSSIIEQGAGSSE